MANVERLGERPPAWQQGDPPEVSLAAVQKTPYATRTALFEAAKSKAEIDLLHEQFFAEDQAVERARRFPPPAAPAPAPAVKLMPQAWADAIADVIGEEISALEQRVLAQLEQRSPASVALPSVAALAAATRTGPAVHDRGLWRADQRYSAGDLILDRGVSWLAVIASKGLRPGEGSAWRLVHKTETAHIRRLVREELTKQQKGAAAR